MPKQKNCIRVKLDFTTDSRFTPWVPHIFTPKVREVDGLKYRGIDIQWLWFAVSFSLYDIEWIDSMPDDFDEDL